MIDAVLADVTEGMLNGQRYSDDGHAQGASGLAGCQTALSGS